MFAKPFRLKLLTHIFFLLTLGLNPLISQKTDSLKRILPLAKEDTNKVNSLLVLCSQNDIIDAEKIKYAENALTLSEKLNFRKGIIIAHASIGAACNNIGQFPKALGHLDKALNLALQYTSLKEPLAAIYNSLGASYYYKGDYKTALNYFQKSLDVFYQLKKQKKSADVLSNIANIYYQNQQYDKALEYNAKASTIFRELKDTLSLANILTQYGNIAYDQFQYDTAITYFKKALKLTEQLNDKSFAIIALNGMGAVSAEKGLHVEAVEYFKQELEMAKSINDQLSVANALMNLGKEYDNLKNRNEAVKLLKESIALSKEIGARRLTCDAYSFLSESYENNKDHKNALEYAFLFMRLKDSLFSEENASQINELTAKYETEKKEKAIALLNAELSTKEKDKVILSTSVKQKNNIIIILAVGSVLVLLLVYLFFSRQKLKDQKNSATALIQVQENERNRIAKELHDGIGTFLSTLKLNLHAMEGNAPNVKKENYTNSASLIDKTSEELRRITKNLSNEELQENGLANALNELKERINASGTTNIHFMVHEPSEKFDSLVALNLYRIAQELLNNSIKHSKATEITLQLIDHGNSYLLMLEDNGVGFNTDEPKKNGGMGLKNIKDRVNFLKGTLKIESILQKGSTFIIEVPKNAA